MSLKVLSQQFTLYLCAVHTAINHKYMAEQGFSRCKDGQTSESRDKEYFVNLFEELVRNAC